MKYVDNEDGIALVTALMFTMITLAMVMALMYYVLLGTKMSAAQKKYRSALEASYGGAEFVTKALVPKLLSLGTFDNISAAYTTNKAALIADFGGTTLGKIDLTFVNDSIIKKKLAHTPDNWGIAGTSGARHSLDPKVSTDFIFTLKGSAGNSDFKVYSKIVDTVPGVGLVDSSGIDYLDAGIGVAGTSTSTQTPRTPSIYTVEIQGEAAVNPREKSALSVLYAY